MSKTTDADLMEKLNSVLYKTSIELISILSQENFSMWHSREVNLLDLLKIKTTVFSEKAALTSTEELVLRTVLATKIDTTIHFNVINHTNKEDGMLIWKSINKYFASTQLANRAQVWNNFSMLNYVDSDINRFITCTCAAIEKMHEKFPKTPELNLILSAITHSIHLWKSASFSATPHPQHCFWMLHPHLRPNSLNPARAEKSVSRFHSSISHLSINFVRDSGSSAHMISNLNLFFSIDIKEEGIVRTSSGAESLKIKGIGLIKLSNSYGDIFLQKVLYVPKICVNLLSNNKLCMGGCYVMNLPTLDFFFHQESSYIRLWSLEDHSIPDILKLPILLKKFIWISLDLLLPLLVKVIDTFSPLWTALWILRQDGLGNIQLSSTLIVALSSSISISWSYAIRIVSELDIWMLILHSKMV
ncbi:hypothetical protein VP01_5704g1 [Puccinia sorghi]|uniref:Retrovirus-related Pol polyprotein from transposon TNT 1-94-like beta-barrel domain-containing protein n=1 Tax=Puccinia sorghi TaxID=27349 RepID=A0A0L6UKR1_9BASI|nr:hypothetical protein VP01_5704g1 [Puccinia sorghi]